jgi:hypothetical protein
MAAGLTDYVWTMEELLSSRDPLTYSGNSPVQLSPVTGTLPKIKIGEVSTCLPTGKTEPEYKNMQFSWTL